MRLISLVLTPLLVFLGQGCVDDPAETATLAPTADGSSSTGSDSATSTSGGDTDTDTSTTGPECVDDDDCDGNQCVDGECFFYCAALLGSGPLGARQSPIELYVDTPDVVFVVDKSASMVTSPFDDDGDPQTPVVNRWAGLHAALGEFILANDAISSGLVLFPGLDALNEYNANACIVEPVPELNVAQGNGALFIDVMPPADAESPEIAGATPTRAAIKSAHAHLATGGDMHRKAIVLVTDGPANCSADAVDPGELLEAYDASVVDAVASAYADGIPTYVVGLDISSEPTSGEQDGVPDGVNLHAALSELAVAGGTASDDPDAPFANAANGLALAAALAELAPIFIPCEITPGDGLLDLGLHTTIGQTSYDEIMAEDCATADGWTRGVDDEGVDTMVLCGQACADLRQYGAVTFYPPGC